MLLGTGGVSIFALQIAKAMGASVIATSSSDGKLERARELGADHVINYKAEPDWGEAVKAFTGGRGVDHVVEVGGPGTLAQSIAAGRIGGHIALIGVLTGRAGEVPIALMMAKQVRLQGLIVGHRRHQADMVRAMEATGLRPVIVLLLILRIGDILSVGFEQFILQRDAVGAGAAEVLDTFTYYTGVVGGGWSSGAAAGLAKGIVSALLIYGANKLAHRFGEDGIFAQRVR